MVLSFRHRLSCCLLSIGLLLLASATQAEQWVEAGQSSVGKHFVDPSSVTRNPELQQVSVMTRVDEANGGRWLTSMLIECQQHRFSYQHGYHLDAAGKQSFKFDAPRASEPITAASLPDQLQQQYCAAPGIAQSSVQSSVQSSAVQASPPPAAKPTSTPAQPQWLLVGNSNTGEVSYDQNSLRAGKDGGEAGLWTVHARVKPFNKNEQTLSTISLDCRANTFSLLQAQRVHDGKTESLFDKPQPMAPLAKSTTAKQLAAAICQPQAKTARNPFQDDTCKGLQSELQALENRVQADVDGDALYCDTMGKYLNQLANLSQAVEKNHCAIHGLEQYQREIRAVGCERANHDQ